MRVSCQILVGLAILLGSAQPADAEKVRTNQDTKLYSRPGEQSKVLTNVDEGQNMTLLEQEGRWLKVRVKGRTGYVPRSKVDMAEEEDIARNTRRRPFVDGRSRRRGFGQEAGPDDRVGADATGEGEGEEEDAPKPKKASKTTEEAEEEVPKAKKDKGKKKVVEEEEEEAPKAKAKAKKDPEPKAKKGKGDDEAAIEDDEEPVDDESSDEPEDDRPILRVTKKVSVLDKPKSDSEELFVARPSDALYFVEERGKWTFIENSEGDGGWVESDSLESEGGDDDGGGGGDDGGKRKRTIDLGARLGLMFIGQQMRTTGSNVPTVPDNYNITTSSVTLSLAGGILMPFKAKYLLGGELTYDYAKTFFGGVFYDPDGGAGDMPGVYTKLAIHNINVRGVAGYDLRKKSGMAIFGRLGYRYQSFLVDGYADMAKNPAKLPQEIVKGPTVGAAFVIPRLTGKIGMKVSLDAILLGASIAQTKGLEDGAAPTAKAVVVGAGASYKWKKSMNIEAVYDLRYMNIEFGPPLMTSTRGHTGSNIVRTDFFHIVTVGVTRPF